MRRAGFGVALSLGLCLAAWPGSGAGGATLEGLLFGLDGAAAAEHRVLLIDASGQIARQAETGHDGHYKLTDLPTGRFALALRTPEGEHVRVLAPPLALAPGSNERRDIRLAPAPAGRTDEEQGAEDDDDPPKEKTYGPLRIWWVGLSKATKTWTVVGIIGGAGAAYWLLDSDDPLASESAPTQSR